MKLSLDALKEKAEEVVTEELLESISGGLENECHDGYCNSWTDFFIGIGSALFNSGFGR